MSSEENGESDLSGKLERLGHSSIAITLDTYSHVAPGLQQAAAARFDEAFIVKYNERENEAIENHY